MPQAVAQRVITISLVGTDESAVDFYSYWSPMTGLSYTMTPVCDLVADQPINSLFVLDYFTTMNGWIVTGMSPREGSPVLETQLGPERQSIMTMDPDLELQTYRYYLIYANTVTGAQIMRDPQQGNIPKPQPSIAPTAPSARHK